MVIEGAVTGYLIMVVASKWVHDMVDVIAAERKPQMGYN